MPGDKTQGKMRTYKSMIVFEDGSFHISRRNESLVAFYRELRSSPVNRCKEVLSRQTNQFFNWNFDASIRSFSKHNEDKNLHISFAN